MDIGLKREVTLELRGDRPVANLTVSVAAYTSAGDGPWSLPVPLEPWRPGNLKPSCPFRPPSGLPLRGTLDSLPTPLSAPPAYTPFLP